MVQLRDKKDETSSQKIRKAMEPSDHTWSVYKEARQSYFITIKAEKRKVLTNAIQSSRGDSKKLFNLVKSLTGTNPHNPLPSGSDQELAQTFSNFFMEKIQKIRNHLDQFSPYVPAVYQDFSLLETFNPVTEDEVRKTILSLHPKSCELDPIPVKLFRDVFEYILEFLIFIFNKSLETGWFVSDWKCAVLQPLIKGSNLPTNTNNYRPMSNLNFLSKVLEKLVLSQFMSHCNDHDLLPEHQSAYRPHHSCEIVLIKIMDDILWGMENGKVTAMLFLDLSAAFDTVDHYILHKTLRDSYNVQGKCLEWFDLYLQPWECKTAIGLAYSGTKTMNFSVPQGSCMGPSLFTIYAGSIGTVIKPPTSLYGYADDHTIGRKFKPGNPGQEEITLIELLCTVSSIQNWMDSNKLKLNPTKTEMVFFGTKKLLKLCLNNAV